MSVSVATAGGWVADRAVFGDQFRNRNLPFIGSGPLQHLPCRGAGHAHAINAGGAYAHAAAGDLQVQGFGDFLESAVHGGHQHFGNLDARDQVALGQRTVGVAVFRRRFHETHLVPVGIQLVRQHLRQCGLRPLTHFGMGDNGGDVIIGVDLHKRVDQNLAIIGDEGRQFGRSLPRAKGDADYQRGAAYQAGSYKAASSPLTHAEPPRPLPDRTRPPGPPLRS